jgi:hypothetical protein
MRTSPLHIIQLLVKEAFDWYRKLDETRRRKSLLRVRIESRDCSKGKYAAQTRLFRRVSCAGGEDAADIVRRWLQSQELDHDRAL